MLSYKSFVFFEDSLKGRAQSRVLIDLCNITSAIEAAYGTIFSTSLPFQSVFHLENKSKTKLFFVD